MTTHSNYNDIPYTSASFPHCQPGRLRALAKMKGLNPAELEHAKVLEIGCSFGGNLIPFAIRYPNSTVIGIDLADKQIATGQKMMQEIGLDNVHLIAADISKVNFENLKFDYIICHGVYSWVPHFVQEAILKLIQTYLAPQGVAFISYNAYPGWHRKEMLKMLMNFGTDEHEQPLKRVDLAQDLLRHTEPLLARYSEAIHTEYKKYADSILQAKPYYLAHEYFEEHNYPFYFHQFAHQLDGYGLAFLTDSLRPSATVHSKLTSEEWRQLYERFDYDVNKIEQYNDFLTNRVFRGDLICHAENVAGRTITDYNTCSDFFDMYLKTTMKYVPEKDDKAAYWSVANDACRFTCSPTFDALAKYLNSYDTPQKVSDIMKGVGRENDKTLLQILVELVHIEDVFIAYSGETLAEIGDKPKLADKFARLIQFVKNNPNITLLSSIYGAQLSLSLVLNAMASSLDGTHTKAELQAILRSHFENETLIYNKGNTPIPAADIADDEIAHLLDTMLDELRLAGYFNEYV